MIKCAICNGTDVHEIKVNNRGADIDITPLNNVEQKTCNDLPYVFGGTYCFACQCFVPIIDTTYEAPKPAEEPKKIGNDSVVLRKATEKQIQTIQKNKDKVKDYDKIDFSVLSFDEAWRIIGTIKEGEKAVETPQPKPEAPSTQQNTHKKASEKQIAYIKSLIADMHLEEEYKTIDYKRLNNETAKKIIYKLQQRKKG